MLQFALDGTAQLLFVPEAIRASQYNVLTEKACPRQWNSVVNACGISRFPTRSQD